MAADRCYCTMDTDVLHVATCYLQWAGSITLQLYEFVGEDAEKISDHIQAEFEKRQLCKILCNDADDPQEEGTEVEYVAVEGSVSSIVTSLKKNVTSAIHILKAEVGKFHFDDQTPMTGFLTCGGGAPFGEISDDHYNFQEQHVHKEKFQVIGTYAKQLVDAVSEFQSGIQAASIMLPGLQGLFVPLAYLDDAVDELVETLEGFVLDFHGDCEIPEGMDHNNEESVRRAARAIQKYGFPCGMVGID